ncbi:hypothetical protein AB0B50_32660 [Streptomyces sp. NPDC041068]|uniref:hypothetical protein n=1 Tax=Streptomyces sp. NPDC041068 TaxID=3155130 RepID=UPI0033DC06C8
MSAPTSHRRTGDTYRPGSTIGEWRPEDDSFWRSVGHKVANRNLWVSIPALMLGFVVWQVWSVTAVRLNDVGFGLTTSQLFWLTAIPGLTGGTFRVLYTFIGPIFGERKFTAFYATCLVVCWWFYARKGAEAPS